MSSVYLSDDSSTSGFVIVPEFDDPETIHGESNHPSRLSNLPAVASSNPLSPSGVDDHLCDLEPIGSHHSSYLGGGSFDTSVVRDDDLAQRLGSAYEHIRSMPSAASPEVLLSSDPQMLRKQLGVPQHSVLNYPIYSSLDLPNPHTSPHEPMSPRLPSATSPDVSHARTPKKLGSRVDTGAYSPSPPHRFADLDQHAQSNSMEIVPTLPENTPSEHSTLGEPWSAHTARTSKPTKRRVEKPIVSPSSLPSSRRQALRGVLRKPAPDTFSSNNVLKSQTSLPPIRSPSPFRVDIVSLFIDILHVMQ